ncbi:hypothetical protein [Bacillus piscicola]|uniref:hypothetical protein n=1 Tax=Bacillus piscicola TaxID=1632684 RepID=UPI001F09A472|nr:hypothetical protein [Bacillus piscicola]
MDVHHKFQGVIKKAIEKARESVMDDEKLKDILFHRLQQNHPHYLFYNAYNQSLELLFEIENKHLFGHYVVLEKSEEKVHVVERRIERIPELYIDFPTLIDFCYQHGIKLDFLHLCETDIYACMQSKERPVHFLESFKRYDIKEYQKFKTCSIEAFFDYVEELGEHLIRKTVSDFSKMSF